MPVMSIVMLPFYSDLLYPRELRYDLAHALMNSSTFLASLDLLQLLPRES